MTWDSLTGRRFADTRLPRGPTAGPWAISPDGRTLAFMRIGTTFVQLWDVSRTGNSQLDQSQRGRPFGGGLGSPGWQEPGGRTIQR